MSTSVPSGIEQPGTDVQPDAGYFEDGD